VERQLVEALFVRYRTPVYHFLCRYLGDRAVAEDLTQDVFLRALAARYHPDDRERSWVFQIARNLARDHLRKAMHRGPTVATSDDEPGPFTDRAVALDVHAAIHRLPDDDREVFLLREVAGLSYDEIAESCGVTSDAVRNRLHRARLALRHALSSNVTRFSRARP
jgi:RNA polymerase sigma-70 factor (ECF subfamily)